MPISVFAQEAIAEMSRAFETTCDALRLKRVDDAATKVVAQRIVELAQRGVCNAEELHALCRCNCNRSVFASVPGLSMLISIAPVASCAHH
jgi:hypothetical protein